MPFRAAEAAFREIVALARADGRLDDSERVELERFRAALGLEDHALDTLLASPPSHQDEPLVHDPDGYRNVLRMMARVAHADGRVCSRELPRLRRLAERLGISAVEFAEISVSMEHEAAVVRHRRQIRRGALGVGLGLALLAAAAFLSRPTGRAVPGYGLPLPNDLARVAEAADLAVVLVVVDYTLRDGSLSSARRATGTGFFVSPDGLLVTNRHVVRPWEASAEARRLLESGYHLDAETVHRAVWKAGSRVLASSRDLDETEAWSDQDGTLEIVAEAATPRASSATLRERIGGDLALLRAHSARPLPWLPIARDDHAPAKLDPVVVVGFPEGLLILERGIAETAPVLGVVRKVEDSLYVSAPMLGGNSGGPVLDRHGEVVGVATAMITDATLGCCVRPKQILELFPSSSHFVDAARGFLDRAEPHAARAALDLALRRLPSPSLRAEIRSLEQRLPENR